MRLDAVRLWAVARKEWLQLRRDPRSMALAFLLPVLMLVLFGYAITWDIRDLRLGLVDHDGTQSSRALADAFEASGFFRIVERLEQPRDADGLLDRGQLAAVLVIPPGFARDLAAGRRAPVQLLLDGADANTATIAQSYADAIVARYSLDVVLQGRRLVLPVQPEVRIWYNPTLESRHMIVPGLIAVIMSIIAAMLTSLTIAREWERGTMEQLAATPVHRLELILGKLLPYLLIGLFDVAMTTVLGMLIFGVPLRGDVLQLAAATTLFLTGALGLGIFISAMFRSQLLAMQAAMVATYLPALILSGFIFEISGMPAVLRAVTYVVPARYFIGVTRGIFLKAAGFEALWVHGVSMIIFATVGLALATLSFRKEIAR